MIPLNWELRLPLSYFGILMPLNKQAEKGVAVMAGATDPDQRGKMGLLFPAGGKEIQETP